MTGRTTAGVRATAVIGVLLAGVPLDAQDTDRVLTEALSRRASARLQTLHQDADRLLSEERSLLGDLRRLEVEREIKVTEFRQADAAAHNAEVALDQLDSELRQLEEQVVSESPSLRGRLVHLYKLGQGRYVRLLLSTSDASSIRQAARVVAAMAARDQDRLATHTRRVAELTTSRQILLDRQLQASTLREAAARAKVGPERAVAARNTLIREISQRRDLNARLAAELLAAQQKLQAALTMFGADMPSGSGTLPLGPFRGDLDWPVRGALRRPFVRSTLAAGPVPAGIDIAAEEGAPVVAVHGGTVAFADTFAGFGNLVIIDHGYQSFSLYGNLAELAVAKGDRIANGDVVGPIGVAPTGAVGLYFELRVDGRPVDPVQWLKKR
ncbi:MAG: peptidoglycan DD-metalloendopeptidase family protein [Luteitalea sp.]|nr:peptidoglycan DD-metalloendopeptidase family protein [Luteitalea sp.]